MSFRYNGFVIKNNNIAMKKKNNGEVVIYKAKGGNIDLRVRLDEDSVWLDAHQIAEVFGVQRPAVVKHINNIYKTKELLKKTTCSILEQVAADGKKRKMNLYNLDMIISVGYRVNSKRATQFRIWATKVLKKHIVDGYTFNKKRLIEVEGRLLDLRRIIDFLNEKSTNRRLGKQGKEILDLLASYSKTLTLLDEYDQGKLKKPKGKKSKYKLDYRKSNEVIARLRDDLISKKRAGDLFGNEMDGRLEGIVNNLYQTFDGKELYSTIEEKAASLIYLIIKDHPFTDGNKRIASYLFVYFLDRNDYLYRTSGEKKINDNALVVLALLIAESDPGEKDVLVKIVCNLISGN